MKRISCACLLPFMTALLLGKGQSQNHASDLPGPSSTVVSGLYREVVARHPLGVPSGTDLKVFSPYLSKRLLHRFDTNNACFADWRKRHPELNLKPPVGLIENGLFSGGEEEAQPQAFHIEKTEAHKDGSSRVYVRLTVGDPPGELLVWYVAAVVVREGGRPVVDDVLYLTSKNGEVASRLSQGLSSGCNGSRWVGEGRPH